MGERVLLCHDESSSKNFGERSDLIAILAWPDMSAHVSYIDNGSLKPYSLLVPTQATGLF